MSCESHKYYNAKPICKYCKKCLKSTIIYGPICGYCNGWIKEMVLTTTEIERVLGTIGETPYDPLGEEKYENTIGESSIDKQLSMLNEILIHFFRESSIRNGGSVNSSGNTSRC